MPFQCSAAPAPEGPGPAADAFTAGHLGELTRYVPFDLVDAVLAETGRVQKRLRLLPSRVGVYFLLALGLFPHLGYARVWGMLTSALPGAARVSEKALRDVRHRIGPKPVKLLFDTLAVPAADPRTPGLRYRRWRTVAFDGCASLHCPDSGRNCAWLGRAATGRGGFHGYPCLQLMTLAETGTRALLGAVFGPRSTGEITYAARLVDRLDPDMLLLADRAFDGGEFLAAVRTTGAQFLVRMRAGRRLPRLAVLPDGSILTRLGRLDVRVVQAQVTTRLADGTRVTGHYALATSLLDHRAHPTTELIELYHERWEIESSYLALRHTLLRGRVLRSMDPAGLEQELWSLLTLYQILRHVMVDAARSRPGLDPDRVSFTAAAATAQATVVRAAGIADQHDPAPPRAITTAVLAHPLPARRARLSARKVKSPISRYAGHPLEERPLTSTRITSIDIDVENPGTATRPEPSPAAQAKIMKPGSRVDRVFALLGATPGRSFTPSELARTLGITNINSFSVQLATWARRGLLGKPARGRYTIPNNCP
ncbi:IS4 family transposase [Streptomyces hebeiensis]|uniref:IS4 family transposase n=1 Tax=Streptomyces hebeiensis TaxID=229486 RepID=A0ABN1UWU9_9ACTN